MNPGDGFLGLVGGVIGSILIYAGVRFTARQSNNAAKAATVAEAEAAAAATRVESEKAQVEAEKADLAKINALWTRLNEQQVQIDALTRREGQQHDLLMRHAAWDYVVVQKLRDAGIEIGDAPALTLPRET